jgi:hypothetical protein
MFDLRPTEMAIAYTDREAFPATAFEHDKGIVTLRMGSLSVDVDHVHCQGNQAFDGFVVQVRVGELQVPMVTELIRVGSLVHFNEHQIFKCITR